ncbi:MAG: beta-ketoacyl-ACP synthase II [Phycisphaerales bacterium]|nr:beta-ketoacyl-ACP synthase II [Phycisphaerales bacterium]
MKTMQLRRVVITGLGALTNLGEDVDSTWKALIEGRSGIGPMTAFEQDESWNVNIAGEIRDFDCTKRFDEREAKKVDPTALYAMWTGSEAAEDSGIDFTAGDPYSRGVAIGSGIGGVQTMEEQKTKLVLNGPRKVSPFTVPKLMINAAAGNLSILLNLRGANTATATACASGAHSIVSAYNLIQLGQADVMLAGGSEAAVTPLCLGGFMRMKALSKRNDDPTKASRPFDKDRDGFVLAEGAGIVVLEDLEHARARGAKIYAEVVGGGTTGDAGHIAAPDSNGDGAYEAMRRALGQAGLDPSDIDYINAHGTSTPLGDAAEVAAIKRLFGDQPENLLVSSTKSSTGHTLGAAGGLETIFVTKAIQEQVVPATINLDEPDEGFNLDFVANTPREAPIRYAINNSFGFGGHNVSLILKSYSGE